MSIARSIESENLLKQLRIQFIVSLVLLAIVVFVPACFPFGVKTDMPETMSVHSVTSNTLPVKLKWQADTNDPIRFRPYSLDGLVLVKTTASGCARCRDAKAKLIAFDAATGDKRWESAFTGLFQDIAPIALGETIIFPVNADGAVRAIDKRSGKTLWETERVVAHTNINGLTQDSKRVYVGTASNPTRVAALDPQTGKTLWETSEPFLKRSVVTLHLYKEKLYALSLDQIFVLDPVTGNLLKQYDADVSGFGAPTVQNEFAYTTRLGGINALDMLTSNIQWTFEPDCIQVEAQNEGAVRMGRFFLYPPTLDEGLAFVNGGCRSVFALRANTGQIKWEHPLDSLSSLSRVVVTDGVAYVLVSDGTLRALDLTTGGEIGRAASSPIPLQGFQDSAGLITSENILFATFGDRTLFAFSK